MPNVRNPLVLLCLNEINFDLVHDYCVNGRFPNLKMITEHHTKTSSEASYELLEPWIQWVSVFSGKTADQHGVFRLGDVVGADHPQIFEELERLGYAVGAIAPMNAANRLRNPAYFIPDPWTPTSPDGSAFSRGIARAVAQAVNDNAQGRITVESVFWLVAALVRFASPRRYASYLKLAFGSLRRRWKRAIFLDLLLGDIHGSLFKKSSVNFSTLFLNAGAHIQHHYLYYTKRFSSIRSTLPSWYLPEGEDPFLDVISVYEDVVAELMAMKDVDLLIATGLTQEIFLNPEYYWRLNDHGGFLREIGVNFSRATPRMTRDFLVEFDAEQEAKAAEEILAKVWVGNEKEAMFGVIDNRGKSLFVTLTYPGSIDKETVFGGAPGMVGALALKPFVAFVALKNGRHASHGYAFVRGELPPLPEGVHVAKIHDLILNHFS